MAKINSLRDIIQFNSNFKTAINLYLSLNKAEKVLGYIPTKSSVSFLGEYLKAVLENKEQATLLVGPYGKGKSHLLLVLLAVLSMKKTPESESAINELIDNVSKTDEVGERVSEYIGQVWDKKRFLPVLITDTTGDLSKVVKAVTDVYMENWNTGSLEEFVEALTSVKNEVESIRDDSVSGELELKFIGRNGETIKKLYSYADENTGSILRNVIEDTLDEYDDLSVNDRVSILLEMIEKIIK